MVFSITLKPIYTSEGPAYTAGRDRPCDHILLHHTASGGSGEMGGAMAVWRFWNGLHSPNRVSANDIVGKDGSIICAVKTTDTAWHSGSSEWNARSHGIEIVNWGNGTDPYPDIQIRALAWLIRKRMGQHPKIQVAPLTVVDGHQRLGDIWEHAEVSTSGKIDMSSNFPWKKLYEYIKNPPIELTGKEVKVPVPVDKPAWWDNLEAYLKKLKK